MLQPVHHAPAVCFLYLVMYQVKGETGQDKRDMFWFSELATKAVPPPESIHPFPLLIYVLFSLPFLWSLFLGAWSDNSVMNIRGRAASSHVSEARARTHASRAAASKPVPENGLPEWQQNWKLLKYLNIRSLWGLPCNYTCSYHISTNACECTDQCCMWAHMQAGVYTPNAHVLRSDFVIDLCLCAFTAAVCRAQPGSSFVLPLCCSDRYKYSENLMPYVTCCSVVRKQSRREMAY